MHKNVLFAVLALFLAMTPALQCQTTYIIGNMQDVQSARNEGLQGTYVDSVSDVPAGSNVILLSGIFSPPDHYPLYLLQVAGCRVIRLEGHDQAAFLNRVKSYNDYCNSGNNPFGDIQTGMGQITQQRVFPLIERVDLSAPERKNLEKVFVPQPLFNSPQGPEAEYIPPVLADFAKTGRIALDIRFAPESPVVPADDFSMLRQIALMLKLNTGMRIVIEGHTDQLPTAFPGGNLNLSRQRANNVKEFFVNNGAEASRIRTVGYGATRPVSESDMSRNRRVEIARD